MSNLKLKITTAEALRLVVKSKQPNSSDTSFLKTLLVDTTIIQSECVLKTTINGEVANFNHSGYYIITKDAKRTILIPLFDESFLWIQNFDEVGNQNLNCSDFYLLQGWSSLKTI